MKEAHAELEELAVEAAYPMVRKALGKAMLNAIATVKRSVEKEAQARYPALAAIPPLMQVITDVSVRRLIKRLLDDLSRLLEEE